MRTVSTEDEAPMYPADMESAFERRLELELSAARALGSALTLIIVEAARRPGQPVYDSGWIETVTRRLLVGDDWLTELADGRHGICLTHSGPESEPPIRSVMGRIGRDVVPTYGIAHYPADAKTAQRLIDVATKRAQAARTSRAA